MDQNAERLKEFIERIQDKNSQKKEITEQTTDIYNELKAAGYDTKTVRKVVKLLEMSEEDRNEEESMIELYMNALEQTDD